MSWKKILFLCLSFIFVLGGVFGFEGKVLADQQTTSDGQTGYRDSLGGLVWTNPLNWGLQAADAVYSATGGNETTASYATKNGGSILYTRDSAKGTITKIEYQDSAGGKKNITGDYSTLIDGYNQSVISGNPNQKSPIWGIVNQSEYGGELNKPNQTSQEQLAAAQAAKARQDQISAQQAAQSKAEADEAAKKNGQSFTCSWWEGFNVSCWGAWISNNVILSAVGLLSGIAGYLFDKIIDFSVINMGDNVKIGNGEYLSDAWKIMRDVVNIAFIFVLLYIGIMTIIKGFESGTSKMIATVVVIALIINFSLFFTKIIIDTSNIIAVNFYQTIQTQTKSSTKEWSGVAGAFLNTLQLGTINKDILVQTKEKGTDMYLNIIKISLGGSVILIILALVLFIASLMFITRYIVLVLVLVTSAAAIGSWILPSLKKSVYDKWWSALIGQAFFAPVFLFFLFLSLRLTQGLTESLLTGKGDLSWSKIFMGDPSSAINLVVMYLVVVGFLVGSIIVSKSLSNMAGSGAGKITGFMGGAALGAGAWVGRRGGGTLGAALNSEKMQERARNSTGWLAKPSLLALNAIGSKAKKGSFDPRNTKGAGALLGAGGIGAKDGWAANKGGAVADDKKWLEFKEGIRGTYSTEELKGKADAAVKKEIEKNTDGPIAQAHKAHQEQEEKLKSLEEEEKRKNEEYSKEYREEEKEKIQKRLEEIQKEKEAAKKGVERTSEAKKEAEKDVRKKAYERFKASKSDKDKLWEAAQKAAKAEEKKDEEKSAPKPDKPKT